MMDNTYSKEDFERQVRHLEEFYFIPALVVGRTESLLDTICEPGHPKPSIGYDPSELDMIAHWICGPYSLIIDVEPDTQYFHIKWKGRESFGTWDYDQGVIYSRITLHTMWRRLEKRAPGWQQAEHRT